jgi:hypothetical protein
MANTVDFFQPAYSSLALPAAMLAVFLDGVLHADLTPLEIVRGSWPQFGWLRLDAGTVAPEQIEDRFPMGGTVRLCQLYNGAPPEVAIANLPLFVGQIEAVETTIGTDGTKIEIVARDLSATLQRITVYGQRVLRNDGSAVLLPGLETVFNPLGRANAARQPVTLDGISRTAFSMSVNEARAWTCAEAIRYLLCEYLPSGVLHGPSLESLLALTEARPLYDLDLTGLDLLEALHRCSEAAGVQFQFVPRLAEMGPNQALVFYRCGEGRKVELNCQGPGESLSVARTNVAVLHSRRDFYPVTHRTIGQGDFRMYEATFALCPAWDPGLEDADCSKFSPSTNPEFYQVKDVFRKWCLNEAGDYSDAPYHQGPPYDFSRLFEHAAYVPRRRHFRPALSVSAEGEPLGYLLEVSIDGGQHWEPYRGTFDNLLDECGVWLSNDPLDMDTWTAATSGLLRVRITASVASDERLTCIIADGPVGGTAPVVDHVLTLPHRFQYRKVSSESLFALAAPAGMSPPDEADGSAALYQFVRQRATASPATAETMEVQTPSLLLHLQPGDRVMSSPESRDLWSSRRDNRSTTWIEQVRMDFQNQCTNLHLVRQRKTEREFLVVQDRL